MDPLYCNPYQPPEPEVLQSYIGSNLAPDSAAIRRRTDPASTRTLSTLELINLAFEFRVPVQVVKTPPQGPEER
jgi:hypothetical protein